ncbi:MAG: hypothetical protein ABIQ10_10270 [Gemmatimonadaceae bacterium]
MSFHFGRAVRSYVDFYRGFRLSVTASLLFGAPLTWEPFAAPQAVFSLAVVVCLAWGMILARST